MNYSTIRNFSILALLLFLICITFENCTEPSTAPSRADLPFDIDKLPELPIASLSKNGELQQHPMEPILTIIPREEFRKKKSNNHPPKNIAQHCKVSSYTQQLYYTQVTYPKVICYPNNAPTGQVVKGIKENKRGDIRSEAPNHENKIAGKKYYKLSTLQSQKIINPIFCSVHGGPWAAQIIAAGSCSSCGPGVTRFELTVASFPEIFISWTGQLQDFPSTQIPDLHVFLNDVSLHAESRQCCFSYKECNGSCISQTINCGGNNDGIGGGI